jgi:hypothetical protein
MFYQVVTHDMLARTWRKYGSIQRDGESARRLLILAGPTQFHHNMYLLSAPTETELDQKFMALERGVSPEVLSLPADMSQEDWRRWEMETGPGGEWDVPYVYTMPQSQPVWLKWLDIWKRAVNGEIGGENDGAVE